MTETDRAILALEGRLWVHRGAKEQAIWSELGLRPTRYYQRLNALLEDPAACEAYPVLTSRLRRQRAARSRLRRSA